MNEKPLQSNEASPPLIVQHDFDTSAELKVSLSSGGTGLEIELNKVNTHDTGYDFQFKICFSLEEEDLDRLNKLNYQALLQLTATDSEQQQRLITQQEKFANEQRFMEARDIPEPIAYPLIFVRGTRKRILDDRSESAIYSASEPGSKIAFSFREKRMYMAEWTVHLSECRKAPQRMGNRYQSQRKGDYTVSDGNWDHMLPQVSSGKIIPTLCLICKPLGEYSAAVNARTAWSTLTTVPDDMPNEIAGFYPSHDWQMKASIWRSLMTMNSERWEALAEFIRWAADNTGELPATSPEQKEEHP